MADEKMDLTFGQEGAAQSTGAAAQADPFADLTAAAPSLTFGEEAAQVQALRMVEEFSKKIDVTDSKAVLTYGVGTQKKMADFSEKTLESVKTKDIGEVGDMVTGLVTQLKSFDIDEEDKGLLGFFKKKGNQVTELKSKYASVEKNVESISKELEKHQMILLKDIELLDRMYELNLNYYKELTMYILAGKKKLKEVRENELPALQKKAEESGLPEDAQAARDLAEQCDRFEKKLYDLQLTRTVAMQTGPQIRMIQASDQVMAEKIQSTIVNTIPLWKNQMVIAIGIEHASRAAKAEREVNEMTNALKRREALWISRHSSTPTKCLSLRWTKYFRSSPKASRREQRRRRISLRSRHSFARNSFRRQKAEGRLRGRDSYCRSREYSLYSEKRGCCSY